MRLPLIVTICVICAFSIHCSPTSRPFYMNRSSTPSLPAFDVQGHRGARGLLPESTLPAFLRALELGVTTLEMDAVITRDRQVVISHEPWFSSRICTQPSGRPVALAEEQSFRIYEMTYEEVAQFDCGMRGNPVFPTQKAMKASKPLLADVIDAAEAYVQENGLSPIFYNIETKSRPESDGVFHPEPDEFVQLLYDVLRAKNITARATIQSFDRRTLQIARTLDPDLSLALLVDGEPGSTGLSEHIELLGFVPSIYSPNYRLVDAAVIEEAHDKAMRVIPWTVNTLDEMRALKDLGVDGLITDYPDIGVSLLREN
jgi:glycerophosphoryl diester phosphodiesterase